MRSGELLMRKGQNAQELYQPVKSEYIIHYPLDSNFIYKQPFLATYFH